MPPPPCQEVLACLQALDRTACRSWTDSHQIDDCEQPNPDDVEGVPEQGEAEQAALDGGAKALDFDLRHHHCQPDQSGGNVQPVAADKGEECGQERAALRSRTDGNHACKLADLEHEEARPSKESAPDKA